MTENSASTVQELSVNECWAQLRKASIGRLAVQVDDHPDIFPINYAVDHGTLVFRTGEGTKVAGALADAPVAIEADGYDQPTFNAWSVVVRGHAEAIEQVDDLMDTLNLPLFPWQAGKKNRFIRIVPDVITGRRFPVASPDIWQTSLSNVRRAPME